MYGYACKTYNVHVCIHNTCVHTIVYSVTHVCIMQVYHEVVMFTGIAIFMSREKAQYLKTSQLKGMTQNLQLRTVKYFPKNKNFSHPYTGKLIVLVPDCGVTNTLATFETQCP